MDAFPWQDVRKACAAGDQAALETIVSGAANCDPSLLLPRASHCAWEQGQRQLCKWILERSWRDCLLEAFNDGDLPKVQWLYKRVRKHFCDDKDDQMFRFVQACTGRRHRRGRLGIITLGRRLARTQQIFDVVGVAARHEPHSVQRVIQRQAHRRGNGGRLPSVAEQPLCNAREASVAGQLRYALHGVRPFRTNNPGGIH
jgi:hypothetical protein